MNLLIEELRELFELLALLELPELTQGTPAYRQAGNKLNRLSEPN
jgi:hypothetical protein